MKIINNLTSQSIINEYNEGLGVEKLALKYHIGKIKIKKILFENGIEIKKLIEDNDYDKGYQDAIEKAKKIIISFIPLPSYKNHNMNYDLELLKEREEYAKQVAEKFEEMMNYEK